MKKYLPYSVVFILLSALAVVVLSVCILCCDKIEMHLWLNSCHTPTQDFFWQYYTYVGEWVPYVIVGLLLFHKAGWASFLLVDVALSGGIGQGIKYWADTDRPIKFFADHAPELQLPLVDGVEMSKWYSFPSGHTITFFALFLTLTIVLGEWVHTHNNAPTTERSLPPTTYYLLPAICFLLALAGGYSRIYLCQHFTEDVVGGIVIGVLTTLGLLFVVSKLDSSKFWNWNLLQLGKK